jgi:hypothetical protein
MRVLAAIVICVFAIIGFGILEQAYTHKSAPRPNNDRNSAVGKWSEAACHRFKSIAQVTDCDYSGGGGVADSYIAVTLAMDSEDAVLLCPAFAQALPHPISNFQMRIKLAATGVVGAMCKRG